LRACRPHEFPIDGLDRFPAQLSGGQRQRVSLMRALDARPAVILLDERIGALGPMVRAELQADLAGIFRSLEKTVVMVTQRPRRGRLVRPRDPPGCATAGSSSAARVDELIHSPAEPFVASRGRPAAGVRACVEGGS